jgi:hypothetical protein
MNKQSVILTKWVTDSNTLLEDYFQLYLLTTLPQGNDIRESLNQIEKTNS